VCFDRFELNYCGDVEVYVNGLRDKVKAAIDDAAPMNGEVFAGLQKAYNDTEEINDYLAAIDQLNEALNKVEASVNAYAKAKEALDAMQRLMESTNVYTPAAYDTYNGIYTENLEKYEARTLTDAEALAIENPETVPGWHAATILDDFLLSAWDTNPDFQNAPYYINTWSTEGDGDGSNFRVPFFEYWTGDGDSLGERTLTATMEGQEPGTYEVSAWVRVRAKNGYEAPTYGISLQANDGAAVNVAAGTQIGTSQFFLDTFTTTGTVGSDGVLKIKFIVAADNNISWLSFKNVKFTKK
jgi:flagellar hook-associated protein FlgK